MDKAVLALIIGWLLSELSHRFRTGHGRVAIGQALSELLELRHGLLVLAEAVKEVVNHLKAPPEFQAVLRSVLSSLIPGRADLHARYVQAVTTIAGVSPVLAYRLRGPETALPLLDQLAGLAASEPSAAGVWPGLEAEIIAQVRPRLEELIRKAAWCHGWRTWWEVRRVLKKPFALPAEVIDRIISQVPKEALRDSGAR